jgi:hypothetical protein
MRTEPMELKHSSMTVSLNTRHVFGLFGLSLIDVLKEKLKMGRIPKPRFQ